MSHDSVTMINAQYQDPETDAAKWNVSIFNCIM